MAQVRSFEYGRDISLLKSALRLAERTLQQKDASQSLFSSDQSHSRTAALSVSNKIQNAYSAGTERAITSSRLHTAVFVKVLLSNDVVGEAELEYFESVLDDLPHIGWPFFAELVSACGWREHFIETLKALSPNIRLRVLEAVHNISKALPYVWSSTVSTMIWSCCISPIKGMDTSKDEILSAFSSLQTLSLSNEASPTEECLLEDSIQFIVNENFSSSNMKMVDWALSLVNVALDFLLTIFEPTEFSLLNPNLWLSNYDDIGKKAENDLYLNSPCLFHVLNGLAWPDVCQLLSRADCLRFGEIQKALVCFGERLAQEENTKHSLCLTHDFCAATCIAGKENKSSLKVGTHEDLWHLIRKMHYFLSSLETVKKDYEAQSPFLAGLKDFVIKWDHEGVGSTVCDKDSQVSAIESILKQGAVPLTSAFTIWIVSHESLLKKEWICDVLNDRVNLLSHPELFHRLFQAALCSDAGTSIKKLVLKVCIGAPLKLQEAMLFYAFSSESFNDDSSPLKLTDFENLLTEKLNLVSDADHTTDPEDKEKILSEFASLCLQSPSEVLEALVGMAVTDGCSTAVSQLLMHLRIVCQHKKKSYNTGQDLLGSIILNEFQRLQSGTPKHQDNFTCLINELVKHSDVLNCDWLLAQIVDYVDMFSAGGQCTDTLFPLEVSMAIAPKISEHYIVPMARILVQMLDEACKELNGARKQKVVHFLHAYLSLDACTAQTNLPSSINLTHAEIQCLLKKKCIFREAYGVPVHSSKLVLLDAKKWSSECRKIASQFPECSLAELLMPHFCLWLAGATSEEWEILSAQLRRALNIDAGHSVSPATFIQELVMCLIGCKNYVAVGNWNYLFTCFANTVMECLKDTKELTEEDLREIVLALVFALSSLPSQCVKQELLLLVDVAQFKKTSALGEELVKIFREALATQCFQSEFVSGVVKASVHKLLAHQGVTSDSGALV